jgi:hypothetical protein
MHNWSLSRTEYDCKWQKNERVKKSSLEASCDADIAHKKFNWNKFNYLDDLMLFFSNLSLREIDKINEIGKVTTLCTQYMWHAHATLTSSFSDRSHIYRLSFFSSWTLFVNWSILSDFIILALCDSMPHEKEDRKNIFVNTKKINFLSIYFSL